MNPAFINSYVKNLLKSEQVTVKLHPPAIKDTEAGKMTREVENSIFSHNIPIYKVKLNGGQIQFGTIFCFIIPLQGIFRVSEKILKVTIIHYTPPEFFLSFSSIITRIENKYDKIDHSPLSSLLRRSFQLGIAISSNSR